MASALNGKFTWYELHTSDLDAAERFYGKVLGWTPRDAGMPDFRYSLMSAAAGCDIAGMMTPMTPNSPRAPDDENRSWERARTRQKFS